MIYEENTIDWKIGDLVIHDCDSKDKRMLMVITKIHDDGTFTTKYQRPDLVAPHCLLVEYGDYESIPKRLRQSFEQEYLNDKKYLHDPARFRINEV